MNYERIGQALGSVGLGVVVLGAACLVLAAFKPAPDAQDVNVVGGVLLFAIGMTGLSAGLLMALLLLIRSR